MWYVCVWTRVCVCACARANMEMCVYHTYIHNICVCVCACVIYLQLHKCCLYMFVHPWFKPQLIPSCLSGQLHACVIRRVALPRLLFNFPKLWLYCRGHTESYRWLSLGSTWLSHASEIFADGEHRVGMKRATPENLQKAAGHDIQLPHPHPTYLTRYHR